jgi:hypothetical protein
MPIIGPILVKAAIARYARTLSTMFSAGVPLVEALDSVAGATGNIVYENAVLKMKDEVSTGQRLQRAMENTGLFPNMVVQMIAVGEESGSLDAMSGKVASFYEEEVDNAVDSMSSLLEPMIMAILGVLVGLVIAMYLPIFKLGAVIAVTGYRQRTPRPSAAFAFCRARIHQRWIRSDDSRRTAAVVAGTVSASRSPRRDRQFPERRDLPVADLDGPTGGGGAPGRGERAAVSPATATRSVIRRALHLVPAALPIVSNADPRVAKHPDSQLRGASRALCGLRCPDLAALPDCRAPQRHPCCSNRLAFRLYVGDGGRAGVQLEPDRAQE